MSADVEFVSRQPVADDVQRAIVTEASELERTAPLPWYEPIRFGRDPLASGRLRGATKCPPLTFQTEDGLVRSVALEDWLFMDYHGMRALVERLRLWSERHRVGWLLTCEGSTLGKIDGGKLGWRLRWTLARSASRARLDSEPGGDAVRIANLRKRYPELA